MQIDFVPVLTILIFSLIILLSDGEDVYALHEDNPVKYLNFGENERTVRGSISIYVDNPTVVDDKTVVIFKNGCITPGA